MINNIIYINRFINNNNIIINLSNININFLYIINF